VKARQRVTRRAGQAGSVKSEISFCVDMLPVELVTGGASQSERPSHQLFFQALTYRK
jgi:hypothetical protein